jgi:hypothetical protein
VIQKTQFSRSKLVEDDPRTLLCRVTRSCCTIDSSIVNAILKWKCVGNEAQCDPNLHNESASHRCRSCCAKAVHAHHLWCSGNVSYRHLCEQQRSITFERWVVGPRLRTQPDQHTGAGIESILHTQLVFRDPVVALPLMVRHC